MIDSELTELRSRLDLSAPTGADSSAPTGAELLSENTHRTSAPTGADRPGDRVSPAEFELTLQLLDTMCARIHELQTRLTAIECHHEHSRYTSGPAG